MGRQENKVRQGVEPFLESGEELLGVCIVAVRGHTRQTAAKAVDTVPNSLGGGTQKRAGIAADQAGIEIRSPMGLALSSKRLLTLDIGTPIGLGLGGKVKGVLSAVPIADVDSIEVKQIALRKNIVLTVRGIPVELEANATASTNELVEGLQRAKPGV